MAENKLKFEGVITKIGAVTEGTGKSGAWKAVEFVVSEDGKYPQSCKFKMFKGGDKVKEVEDFVKYRKVGDMVEVGFNLKVKEYNGKDYNDIEAWSVFGKKGEENISLSEKMEAVNTVVDAVIPSEFKDDLPF